LEQPGGGVARVSGKVESGRRGGFIGAVGLDEGARLIQNWRGESVEIFQGLTVFVPVSLAGMTGGTSLSAAGGWRAHTDLGKKGDRPWARSWRGPECCPAAFSSFSFSFLFSFFSFEICLKFANYF
jgi:hypothetical protein